MDSNTPIWSQICDAVYHRHYEKLLSMDENGTYDKSECYPSSVCIKHFEKNPFSSSRDQFISLDSIEGKIIELLVRKSEGWEIENKYWHQKKFTQLPKVMYNYDSSGSSWVIKDKTGYYLVFINSDYK